MHRAVPVGVERNRRGYAVSEIQKLRQRIAKLREGLSYIAFDCEECARGATHDAAERRAWMSVARMARELLMESK